MYLSNHRNQLSLAESHTCNRTTHPLHSKRAPGPAPSPALTPRWRRARSGDRCSAGCAARRRPRCTLVTHLAEARRGLQRVVEADQLVVRATGRDVSGVHDHEARGLYREARAQQDLEREAANNLHLRTSLIGMPAYRICPDNIDRRPCCFPRPTCEACTERTAHSTWRSQTNPAPRTVH